jgi:predicted DNA-binding protein YlxM (UPF0122 family)
MSRNFIDKILNPQSKQDIFDTIPKAKKLFEEKPEINPMLKARNERKEKLIKNATEHYDKLLEKRIQEIERNTR